MDPSVLGVLLFFVIGLLSMGGLAVLIYWAIPAMANAAFISHLHAISDWAPAVRVPQGSTASNSSRDTESQETPPNTSRMKLWLIERYYHTCHITNTIKSSILSIPAAPRLLLTSPSLQSQPLPVPTTTPPLPPLAITIPQPFFLSAFWKPSAVPRLLVTLATGVSRFYTPSDPLPQFADVGSNGTNREVPRQARGFLRVKTWARWMSERMYAFDMGLLTVSDREGQGSIPPSGSASSVITPVPTLPILVSQWTEPPPPSPSPPTTRAAVTNPTYQSSLTSGRAACASLKVAMKTEDSAPAFRQTPGTETLPSKKTVEIALFAVGDDQPIQPSISINNLLDDYLEDGETVPPSVSGIFDEYLDMDSSPPERRRSVVMDSIDEGDKEEAEGEGGAVPEAAPIVQEVKVTEPLTLVRVVAVPALSTSRSSLATTLVPVLSEEAIFSLGSPDAQGAAAPEVLAVEVKEPALDVLPSPENDKEGDKYSTSSDESMSDIIAQLPVLQSAPAANDEKNKKRTRRQQVITRPVIVPAPATLTRLHSKKVEKKDQYTPAPVRRSSSSSSSVPTGDEKDKKRARRAQVLTSAVVVPVPTTTRRKNAPAEERKGGKVFRRHEEKPCPNAIGTLTAGVGRGVGRGVAPQQKDHIRGPALKRHQKAAAIANKENVRSR
ncbi:hypothetical protein GLOTRDRAFT_126053 [Gloeophyllum trabeum ATCC 11539]|uniref:Uncharacterized protein n=1 Tax=Gloeophyllum trabeum (strain ATCC 11539 / FP-39264 / Madison 617) TaxID=670483 RepID=S7QJB5_GLOTA|nr:uncharacterized protein GLOTRDRAFT_126053 [Gloeophyllum trabeum ATCC 11539]EPQ59756.1 hypothetical protein GLOTRDRAFT_126053 [Gloeophyllum trabeum ATCC 11539]